MKLDITDSTLLNYTNVFPSACGRGPLLLPRCKKFPDLSTLKTD